MIFETAKRICPQNIFYYNIMQIQYSHTTAEAKLYWKQETYKDIFIAYGDNFFFDNATIWLSYSI